MAKGNLFLGSASRSVGDVTFYVRNGQQISRVRRKTIANPRTGIQLARRCILKTVSSAYSILAPICCQSFQGKQSRSMNQARFQKLNLQLLQTRAAAAVDGEGLTEAGVYENTTGNFAGKSTMGAVVNPYVISEGTIYFNGFFLNGTQLVAVTATDIADITYQQFIDAIGAQPGDQLTFCVLFTDTDEYGDNDEYLNAGLVTDFQYGRIVLMPSSGDLSDKMFALSSGSDYIVNNPNQRNEGSFIFKPYGEPQSAIHLGSINGHEWLLGPAEMNAVAAAAVILSRQTNSGWQYSNSKLELIGYNLDGKNLDEMLPLNAAVASFETSLDSSKYLNQARRVG